MKLSKPTLLYTLAEADIKEKLYGNTAEKTIAWASFSYNYREVFM